MADKYLDLNDGGAGDGSIGDPWATLAEAQSECTTGDVIYVKGTVTYTSTFYWDSGKNATLRLWPAQACTITISGSGIIFHIQTGVLNIYDLTFTTAGTRADTDNVIDVGVNGSVISGCVFTSCMGTVIYADNYSSNTTITGCTMAGGLGGHGVLVNGPSTIVKDNTITGITGGWDCIFVQEGGDNSRVYGNDLTANSQKSDIIIRGGVTSDLSGVYVYNNRCRGANTVSGIDIDASGSSSFQLKDIRVYNNIMLGKHSGGDNDTYGMIRVNGPWARTSASPIRIYNNSVSLVGSDTAGECFKAGIVLYAINTGDYIDLSNNIVRVEDTDSNGYAYAWIVNGTLTNVTENYGHYYSTEANLISGVYAWGANTVIGADPDYTNNASDLTLQIGAGGLNTGNDQSTYFTTGLLTTATWPNPSTISRPFGVAWDMGAYESGGASPWVMIYG